MNERHALLASIERGAFNGFKVAAKEETAKA
jgi:hypothetical protein